MHASASSRTRGGKSRTGPAEIEVRKFSQFLCDPNCDQICPNCVEISSQLDPAQIAGKKMHATLAQAKARAPRAVAGVKGNVVNMQTCPYERGAKPPPSEQPPRGFSRCAPSRPYSFAAERHQQRASAWSQPTDSVATQRCRPARAPRPPPLHTCRPTLPTQRACHGRATVGRHATLAREASVESGQGPPLPSHPDSCQLTDLHMSHVTQACTYPAHELALRLRQAARPAPKLD